MDMLSVPLNADCPVAHALDVLGQKWTILILREALQGRTRFADFKAVGAPSDVLASRLAALVDAGVFVKRPYRAEGERTRDEYLLTEAGKDAAVILGALGAWGVKHCGTVSGLRWADEETGRNATVAFTVGGERIDPARVRLTRKAPRPVA